MEIRRGTFVICNINLKETSFTLDEVMGEQTLTLNFLSRNVIGFEINDTCDYEGVTYKIRFSEKVTKRETSLGWEYTVKMFSSKYDTEDVSFFLTGVPERRKNHDYFTGTAAEWIDLIVTNMNRNGSGWSVGTCVGTGYVTLSFKDKNVSQILDDLVKEVDSDYEYWFSGKVINFGKHRITNNGILLGQGEGKGFKELTLTAVDETPPTTVLYPYGSDKNLGSDYGHDYLILPDGKLCLEKNVDKYGRIEESKQFEKVFPKGTFTVTSKIDGFTLQASGIDFNLTDCLLSNDQDVVLTFQDGGLAGYDLSIVSDSWDNTLKQLKLKQNEEENALKVPGDINFSVGDKFILTNLKMPQSYITNSENELLEVSQAYLDGKCDKRVQLDGKCDEILFKSKQWVVSSGQMVQVYSDKLSIDREIRCTKVKRYIEKDGTPSYRYELTLSDFLEGNGFKDLVDEVKNTPEIIKDSSNRTISYTKRRWQDAKETTTMLSKAITSLSDQYTDGITPITVKTMQVLLGDESLQFRFVNSKTNPTRVPYNITYDSTSKTISAPAGIIQHMTLGIKSISSAHADSEYKFWNISALDYSVPDTEAYYLYAKCSKTDSLASFELSHVAIGIDDVEGYYHLLVGILNSEYDGERSFVTLYGFTEILPGRVTTQRVVSEDGNNYIDFLNNSFRLGGADKYLSYLNGTLLQRGVLIVSGSGATDYSEVDRGNYSSALVYYVGEKVKYNGSYYKCILDCGTAGIIPTNTTYWKLVVSKGDAGTPGAEGSSAVVAVLSRDFISFPADSSGNVMSYSNNSASISLYLGGTKITSGLSYSFSASSGVTITSSGDTVSVTYMSSSYSTGTVTCSITYNGITYSKTLTIGKNTQGTNGTNGINGSNGTDGRDGTDGANGVSYWLTCDTQVVTKNSSGTVTPSTIYFYPRKSVGSTISVPTDCMIKLYRDSSSNSYSCSSYHTLSTSSSYSTYKAELYLNGTLVASISVQTVLSSDTANDLMAQQLGYTDYATMVSTVQSKGTIYQNGGYLNANLIDAQAILAKAISISKSLITDTIAEFCNQNGLKVENTSKTNWALIANKTIDSLGNFLGSSSVVSSTASTPDTYGTIGGTKTLYGSLTQINSFQGKKMVISGPSGSSYPFSVPINVSMNDDFTFEVEVKMFFQTYDSSQNALAAFTFVDVTFQQPDASYSMNTSESVSPYTFVMPSNAYYMKLGVTITQHINKSSNPNITPSGTIEVSSTSIMYSTGGGVNNSTLAYDGYGISYNAINFLHWIGNSNGVNLNFKGIMNTGSQIPQKLLAGYASVSSSSISWNGNSPTGYLVDKYGASTISLTRVSAGKYRLVHNLSSAGLAGYGGATINVTPMTTTGSDKWMAYLEYISADSVNIYTWHGDTNADCNFFIIILKI